MCSLFPCFPQLSCVSLTCLEVHLSMPKRSARQAGIKPSSMKRGRFQGPSTKQFTRQINRVLNSKRDKKYKDINALVTVDAVPIVTHLNILAEGSGMNGERSGNTVDMASIHLRACLRNNPAAESNCVMIAVVYDSKPQSTVPNFTEMYDGSASSLAHLNFDHTDRFKQVFRKDYILNGSEAAGGQTANTTRYINEFHKFRMKRVQFEEGGTTGTVGQTEVGAVYLVIMGENTTPNDAEIVYRIRLRYLDGIQ